jgi:cyclopropane-fatty-acyl-phospholipid synthase
MILTQDRAERIVRDIVAGLDIEIGGTRPWDLQVHEPQFYTRVLKQGTLGLGESYMDGWWDVEHLDQFFFRVLRGKLSHDPRRNWRTRLVSATQFLMNRQRRSRSFHVGEHHYDRGNDLYQAMLDRRMVYTCAYWKDAPDLDAAQEAKLELVCRKIGLRQGQRILDIGCGWGSLLRFAAERYGAGLPIEILLRDYRDITGEYDHVVSLGMFEHVGPKNYATYMDVVNRHLKDDGMFLLQTIGSNKPLKDPDLWTEKYTFPGGVLPSAAQIARSIEDRFVLEDWHSFGAHYDRTLMAWHAHFESAWPRLSESYGTRFYRMWRYYLLAMAAAFRARSNQLWQVVLSKNGVEGGYDSIR